MLMTDDDYDSTEFMLISTAYDVRIESIWRALDFLHFVLHMLLLSLPHGRVRCYLSSLEGINEQIEEAADQHTMKRIGQLSELRSCLPDTALSDVDTQIYA
jgi:hypothetical protein